MKISTIPGINGSGPGHWQTLWEEKYGFTRVEQDDWDNPVYERWEENLIRYIEQHKTEKEHILVAHSLGSILVVKSLSKIKEYVKGIFLVATPDLHVVEFLKYLESFQDVPSRNLGIPGYLIYSENDTFSTPNFSENYSRIWGLQSVDIGKKGHINSDSNLGAWEEGIKLLNSFLTSVSWLSTKR